MERRNQARGINEWSDTYGSMGIAPQAQLTQLPLHILDPWHSEDGGLQPFKPYPQAKLEELADNIKKNGVIEPICVRPMPNGRFQIIAGHNRVEASRLAGLSTIPALVQQLDDAQAAILMVDSNLQHREILLPSEKAFAYKLRMEAVKKDAVRTVGRPKNNSSPVETNFRWDTVVAEEANESRAQIQRYIRLTYLIQPLLELVDTDKLAFRAGVELSYLEEEDQNRLFQVMQEHSCKAPSMAQAEQLRTEAAQGELTAEKILAILVKPKKQKPATVKLPAARLLSLFPPDTSPEQMEAEIYEALLAYRGEKI